MAISNSTRKSLESKLTSIEKELNSEVSEISEQVINGTKTALIAGGILAGGYLLYSLFSGEEEEENEREDKILQPGESVTSIVASLGAAIALEAGKEWLEDYLEKE